MTVAAAEPLFEAEYTVSFGDCDPAGIVFYPNIFSWLDRTFHAFLKERSGGHSAVCRALGLKGVGLTAADCGFRSPLVEGDTFTVSICSIEWKERGFKVDYKGAVGERAAFHGTETRALFVEQDGRVRAGNADLLRQRLAMANTADGNAK